MFLHERKVQKRTAGNEMIKEKLKDH